MDDRRGARDLFTAGLLDGLLRGDLPQALLHGEAAWPEEMDAICRHAIRVAVHLAEAGGPVTWVDPLADADDRDERDPLSNVQSLAVSRSRTRAGASVYDTPAACD